MGEELADHIRLEDRSEQGSRTWMADEFESQLEHARAIFVPWPRHLVDALSP